MKYAYEVVGFMFVLADEPDPFYLSNACPEVSQQSSNRHCVSAMKTTKYEQELRITRQGQQQRTPNGEAAASPEDGKTSGVTDNTRCDESAAATLKEVEARERSLEEKVLEAKHALEERGASNEEARIIREELASVKVGAEVRSLFERG